MKKLLIFSIIFTLLIPFTTSFANPEPSTQGIRILTTPSEIARLINYHEDSPSPNPLKTVIFLKMNPQGTIFYKEINKSSGNATFDQAVLDIVPKLKFENSTHTTIGLYMPIVSMP